VDFLPTVCKLAGVSVPESLRPDGEDVSDVWLGKPRARTKPLHWEWLFNVAGGKEYGYMPPMLGVRDGDWKLFVNHNGSDAELFNIPRDIGEEHNVAAENPEVVKSLTAKALAWAKSLPPSPARDNAAATGATQDGARVKNSLVKPEGSPAGKPTRMISPAERAEIFKKWDTNHDGKLSYEEYAAGLAKKGDAAQRFKSFDTNNDGSLSEEEFVKAGKR
jgi:N-acetylgalactosamine-6-sulfatase